jgi:hypothetical protein
MEYGVSSVRLGANTAQLDDIVDLQKHFRKRCMGIGLHRYGTSIMQVMEAVAHRERS